MAAQQDPIDEFIAQWARERPDLVGELDAMATFGRLGRVVGRTTKAMEATLQAHGLRLAEFDVLATLRRLGPPYIATPTVLTRALMLSPAGMTNRLDRLETAGLVERRHDPDDRRSLLVVLTEVGFRTLDAAVADHVATENTLLASLTPRQRRALDDALRTLVADLI